MYDAFHQFVIDEYRKKTIENPNISIREFANGIGVDFYVVWEILGFKDWFDWMEGDDWLEGYDEATA